jgi:inner membrane protein
VFVFAHVGITLGAAVAVAGLVESVKSRSATRWLQTQPSSGPGGPAGESGSSFFLERWVDVLGKFIDLRLLAIGSMMPDIIDKPLGFFVLGGGRSIAHSLVVTLLVLVVGLFMNLNYKRTAVLAVALGMISHLILDAMWARPEVFLWPLYGLSFPGGPAHGYLQEWVTTLKTNPSVYFTECLGLLFLGVILGVLGAKKKLVPVLKRGRL